MSVRLNHFKIKIYINLDNHFPFISFYFLSILQSIITFSFLIFLNQLRFIFLKVRYAEIQLLNHY